MKSQLLRRDFNLVPLRCHVGDEKATVLKDIQTGVCGVQQGGSKFFKQLIIQGYYWLSMEADIAFFSRRSQVCQVNSHKVHAHVVKLHNLPHFGRFIHRFLI